MLSDRLPVLLWRAVAVLVVLHVLAIVLERELGVPRATGLLRQVDLNAEANLTAWFCSFVLLLGAGLAALVAATGAQEQPAGRRWWLLSALLVVMSLDETAQLHDLATPPLRRALDTELSLFHFAWVLPGLAVLVAVGTALLPLVRSLAAPERGRLLRAAAVYVTGAVVLEMVGGLVVDVDAPELGYSLRYLAVMTLEETLELVGAVMLATALLAVARRRVPSLLPRPTVSGRPRGSC